MHFAAAQNLQLHNAQRPSYFVRTDGNCCRFGPITLQMEYISSTAVRRPILHDCRHADCVCAARTDMNAPHPPTHTSPTQPPHSVREKKSVQICTSRRRVACINRPTKTSLAINRGTHFRNISKFEIKFFNILMQSLVVC